MFVDDDSHCYSIDEVVLLFPEKLPDKGPIPVGTSVIYNGNVFEWQCRLVVTAWEDDKISVKRLRDGGTATKITQGNFNYFIEPILIEIL